MSADPDTTRALGEVTSELRLFGTLVRELATKVDDVAGDARQESREMGERVEAHALDTRNRLHDLRNDLQGTVGVLGRDVTALETGFENHVVANREQFNRLEASVASSTADRGRIWRVIAGMGSAGGVGAALARLLGAPTD